MKQVILTVWFLMVGLIVLAGVEGWKTDASGSISITDKRHIDKDHSILWEWNDFNATITVNAPELKNIDETFNRSTFAVWVYNEQPLKDSLSFEFFADDKLACFFHVGLNFTGWRTFWVMYHRDMHGVLVKGMNRLVI